MTLAARLTRLPHAYDAELGETALQAARWATGDVAKLLKGTAGSSPYLKTLIERESVWLEGALDAPEASMKALCNDLGKIPHDQTAPGLRRAKARAALLIGLADLGGVWSLERVTGSLTDFADAATGAAMRAAILPDLKRGKLPGQTEADLPQAGGMVALAMGKMGAGELNYSSDIDLICLFDETRFDPGDYGEARAVFVRATRRMVGLLNDVTSAGYVFRTDLRLRPDPAVTPICMSMEAAERYYESLGRNWERAAYIKARPAAGDVEAGARFLRILTPFVWRKHLDFATIEETHDMRQRIRAHKGLHGPITLPGHNIKLGRGGIREIEFFTQTRQLIAGGRDPDLRVPRTMDALTALATKGWVPQDVAEHLTQTYRDHREVEHRLQMIQDAQTHDLPGSDAGFDRLAALMGKDTQDLKRDLSDRLESVLALTEDFFARRNEQAPETSNAPNDLADSPIPARWPSYPALRSTRATEIFARLKPEILRQLAGASKPEEALRAFDGFLEGLPAGVQLFSLFEANPQLIALLADIVATSPDLARYLSRNASVFDAVIAGDFFAPWPGTKALTKALAGYLDAQSDYEQRLDAARRWGKEWHFRVGVHALRGLLGAREAGRAYADLAEASLAALWPVVQQEFAGKHGAAPGRGAVVLGMGSLAAGQLHPRSDLDLIVIYDADGVDMSDGARPLAARSYYARLTQALVTAMTAPMAEGRLYEIDMRLRPSGNKGPVATSLQSFRTYQREEAWTWEHLALTRARVVAGSESLARDVEAFRVDLLKTPRETRNVLGDVADMRSRIAAAKGQGAPWDAKLGQGRLQDIELFGQTAALLSAEAPFGLAPALNAVKWLNAEDRDILITTYGLLWRLQLATRLISADVLDPETLGSGGAAFVLRLTGAPDMAALKSQVDAQTGKAAQIIHHVMTAEGEQREKR